MRSVHFIGIGGVGMNGLAQLAALSGFRVTGSDRAYDPAAPLFKCLAQNNVAFFPQDGSGITRNTDCVVYSTAIEPENPDLQKAQALNIPLLHRAEFLNELIGDAQLIAVAGTAGKTTTTGLLGWVFESLGKNPSVYNGAAVLNWKTATLPGNIRKGSSRLWIIEADESDRSFLNFHPAHSIITNISKDHYELDELHAMFNRFEEQTSGTTIRGPIKEPCPDIPLIMPGRHNLENARCVLALCRELGMDENRVMKAIAGFKGIERRLEEVGRSNDITVFDDYAHNPVKIAAALATISEKYQTVHAFWRPHGFTPLKQNLNELANVFANHSRQYDGHIFILPVYYAGGTVQKDVSAEDLIKKINDAGGKAVFAPDYAFLQDRLTRMAHPGDAVLGMGARDPNLPLFAKKLVHIWKSKT